jgi:hypothetical protein
MTRLRALTALVLSAAAILAGAVPALALVDLAAVASSDVAVERGASVSAAQRAQLEDSAASLAQRDTPVKYVLLRTKPTDAQGYANRLRSTLAYRGDILVLSPGNLRIASGLRTSDVQAAFDSQRATLRQDPVAGTIAVAERLSDLHAQGSVTEDPGSGDDGAASGGGGALLGILLLGGGAVAVAAVIARRRARARAGAAPAGGIQRASLEPLVDGLAAQIGDLDDDMQIAGPLTTAAREHYDVAVLSYGEARDMLEAESQTPAGLEAARALLEKGLHAARRTRAVLEGRSPDLADEEPLLEGLCSFDPKHGKATTSVTITTPSGQGAELPACASCAADMESGNEPRFREVEEQGRMVPYWQTRGMGMGRGGMGGGGIGPVLGGALAGMILGGMLGGGDASASQGGDQDFGGGGDWGGGGGGDFGGGSGGGGDFGGGGGGDF